MSSLAKFSESPSPNCSFCGRGPKKVLKVIRGDGVGICNECIDICNGIIEEDISTSQKKFKKEIPTPQEIFNYLEEHVIGQNKAKRSLSVAVYNHYKRISPYQNWEHGKNKDHVEIAKSNIMLIGPTGTGKTYLAKTLAKIMNVPIAIVDATSLTEAGYIGEDVENILVNLIQNADNDIKKAQKGIIFIDEIDKIARKGGNASITRDVSGEGVQQALLKIVEGTVANVPQNSGRKHSQQEFDKIDTSNILFIVSGAFAGLEEIISKRVQKASTGFGAQLREEATLDLFDKVDPGDLHDFGLIPEFIGRFPVITNVNPLSEEQLLEILTKPKSSITKQFKKLFELDGVQLDFEEEALKIVAKQAIERKTGARALRSIVENTLMSTMFQIPSHKDIIKATLIANSGKLEVKITRKKQM